MIRHWIEAVRLRTLPLAVASIAMGGILAAEDGLFVWKICLWSAITTLFLQILSNLANDYGDTVHGADHSERQGPQRLVQSGRISSAAMKSAIFLLAALSLASGIYLLYLADLPTQVYIVFLSLGVLAVLAAILYTNGYRPYGYRGLGDPFVFLFFGLVGVYGTYYLQTHRLDSSVLLPAASLGFFTVAVLNINNMRDIESDRLAGKRSIPVRLGKKAAVYYHGGLLLAGLVCALIYVLMNFHSPLQLLFLLLLPLFWMNYSGVKKDIYSGDLDPYLRKMALTTLLFVLFFGVSVLGFRF